MIPSTSECCKNRWYWGAGATGACFDGTATYAIMPVHPDGRRATLAVAFWSGQSGWETRRSAFPFDFPFPLERRAIVGLSRPPVLRGFGCDGGTGRG